MPKKAPCQSTPRSLWQLSSQHGVLDNFQLDSLVEQTSFRDHNDIARAQPDFTFEVCARFIGLVIEHEDRFVAACAAPSNLDTLFCGERAHATRKRDRLHQCGWLSDDVRTGPDNFTR